MSEQSRPSDPVVTTRGLSERSKELLAATRRTDGEAPIEQRPHRVIRSLWWPLLYLVLALGAVDFAIMPLFWAGRMGWATESLMVACCGVAGVQLFLIALGLVFGRQSLASRLVVSCALLLIVFACATSGYMSSVFTAEEVDLGGHRWFSLAGMAWCVLVAVLIGAVLPMCFVRGVLGWRLTNPDEIRERDRLGPEPVNRYTLRDLLVLMTMFGVTLGVPRFTYDYRAGRYDDEMFWAGLALCMGTSLLGSLVILMLAWQLLQPHAEVRWAWSLMTSLGWSLLLSMGLAIAANTWSYLFLGIGWLIWLQAFVCGAIPGLLVLHVHGWRWETTKRPLKLT